MKRIENVYKKNNLFPNLATPEQEEENKTEGKVAFFLGAGASVKAQVPDTFSFVKAFVNSLENEKKEIVLIIIEKLNAWAQKLNPPRKVDIELLLEAFQTLSNRNHDILLPFIEDTKFCIPDFNADSLLGSLRDFIKSKVIVDEAAIQYLSPLRGFIQDVNSPLDIYSANYDTCIELFCSENKLIYKDGFDEAWNPAVFDQPNIDIRLFKIHGSVTWYKSDRGRFLKIPVRTNAHSIDLITKEKAEGIMFYPAQKFEDLEPLFELLMQMKNRLATCRTLFVVGYSFRDEHIRRIFWDIARINKEFLIVLISPSSWSIYQERLKLYEDGKTPSSLSGKVICLPYYFEYIFPVLKREFYRDIELSAFRMSEQNKNETAGRPTKWNQCLYPAALSGDIENLKNIIEKVDIAELDRPDFVNALTSALYGLFYAIASQNKDLIRFYWFNFREIILFYPERLRLTVNYATSTFQSDSPLISPREIYETLIGAYEQFQGRKNWLRNSELFNTFLILLRELREIMKVWENSRPSFDNYIASRTTSDDNLKSSLNLILTNSGAAEDFIESKKSVASENIIRTEKIEMKNFFVKYSRYF